MLALAPRSNIDHLAVAFAHGVGQAPTPDSFQDQMRHFSRWFVEWTDDQRNSLLNGLEDVDAVRVDAFTERYCRLRWK